MLERIPPESKPYFFWSRHLYSALATPSRHTSARTYQSRQD